MADPKIVAELREHARKAIFERGFAILTCEESDKSPWARYSPHAVNSASRDEKIALRAWDEGEAANYGVACGPSNLTVLDADHGLASQTDLFSWMEEHHIPKTLIVQSGRVGEAGFHLYFSGAVPTCGFKIGEVTGELKGIGGYVVGEGSIHPSKEKYRIILDAPVASLPEGLVTLAKEKSKTPLDVNKTKAEHGGLIPAGNRWQHLESVAGKLRNAFLSEDGIYSALKDFAAENCEDGSNYPDDKIREIAHAAITKFDAQAPTPVVFFSDTKKIDNTVQESPNIALEGDWIAELAHLLVDGTFIPLSFARAQIKTILGASLDGMIGYPKHPDLHMKHWTMLISAHPESGKGMSWKRTAEIALLKYIKDTLLVQPKSGMFSSGEHMVKYLSEDEFKDKRCLVNFDEMKFLFDKGAAAGSTLMSNLTSIYDRSDASAGSLTHKGGAFSNLSLSFTGGFTKSSFESALAGKGQGGDGFMSRVVLAYSDQPKSTEEWPDLNPEKINTLAGKMLLRWQTLSNQFAENKNQLIIPDRTEQAKHLQLDFQKFLADENIRLTKENPDVDYTSRLDSYFKRDILLRALFSEDGNTITGDMLERSIAWASHQLYLRQQLWPVDKGNLVERMEQGIIRALKKNETLSKSALQSACNVFRAGSGGMDTFNRAWAALTRGNAVKVLGKTHKGTEVYGLEEGLF